MNKNRLKSCFILYLAASHQMKAKFSFGASEPNKYVLSRNATIHII